MHLNLEQFCFKLLLTATACLISSHSFAQEQSCKFDYWQVIPDSVECDVYFLPDFDFRKLPEDPNIDVKLRRFCQNFEVRFGHTSKIISYCKDPDKDGSGPTFLVNEKIFLADLYFEGCLDNKPTLGKVFVADSWAAAPKNLKRIWRIKNKGTLNSCLP